MLNNLISLIFVRCLTMLLTFHELINRVSQPYWETFYFIHLGSTSKIQGDHSVPPLLTALFYMKYRTFRDFTFSLPHSSSSAPLSLPFSHTQNQLSLYSSIYLSLPHINTHKPALYLALSLSLIHTHKLALYLFLSICLIHNPTNQLSVSLFLSVSPDLSTCITNLYFLSLSLLMKKKIQALSLLWPTIKFCHITFS